MRRSAAGWLLVMTAVIALGGCGPKPFPIDPLRINARDGGDGTAPDFASMMRIGVAARKGGDYPTAVAVFRRAADVAPRDPVPFIALGDTLVDMNSPNEAVVAYNSALERDHDAVPALRGLAAAYLLTGRGELALQPLDKALAISPNDPKLLMLHGVADDLSGRHLAAQDLYRRGLRVAPLDVSLNTDLALSLAMTSNYPAAIATLSPVAMSPAGGPHERQTLAMIYGLQGDQADAARVSRMDLDEAAAEHNLADYATLRNMSADARNRAILSLRGPS